MYVILQCRLLLSYACTYGADLNWKERLYITISGFPKATVQARLLKSMNKLRFHRFLYVFFSVIRVGCSCSSCFEHDSVEKTAGKFSVGKYCINH